MNSKRESNAQQVSCAENDLHTESPLNQFPPLADLTKFETSESHKTLLFGSSHLQMDMLPELFDALEEIGKCDHLDVVIAYCRGGQVNVSRRIALLLHEFAKNVRFIVPYYCQSAATVLSLCANEIITGPMAIFSPIDPQLSGADNGAQGPSSLSAQEIKTFSLMAKDWFALPEKQAQEKSLELLSQNVFPPSMAAFYRNCEEIKQIGLELIDFQLPDAETQHKLKIVEKLLYGYHSHGYALTGPDLDAMGLKINRNEAIEDWAWSLARAWQPHIGGRNRTSENAVWNDTLIATSTSIRARQREVNAPAPLWLTHTNT